MKSSSMIKSRIIERLRTVIDPETGMDVITMSLVEEIEVDDEGQVTYVFRPSSPICPLAVSLAMEILKNISQCQGVNQQHITVRDYIHAEQLNDLLQQYLETLPGQEK